MIRAEAEVLDLPALGGIAALREGELLLAQGDARAALGAFGTSARALKEAGTRDQLAIALARTSEALVADGDLRAALDVCARGIELVERDRDKTSGAYMQASYLRRTISLYANGVLAAHARGDGRALEWAELAKGRVQAIGDGVPGELRERLAELGERIDACRDDDAELALRQRGGCSTTACWAPHGRGRASASTPTPCVPRWRRRSGRSPTSGWIARVC